MSEPSLVKHSLATSSIVKFFLVGILFFVIYYISNVVLAVVAAVILASSVEPAVLKLQKYRVHRVLAVIFVYLFIAICLMALIIFFVPIVANELIAFLQNVPQTFSVENFWAPVQSLGINVGQTSIAPGTISMNDFIGGLQSLITGSSTGAFQTATFIFGGLLGFILIVVLAFYFSVQEDGVADFLRIVTPIRHHNYIIDLWKRSQRKIGYWLQGQLILGVVVGVLVYLTLLIVGIKHALLLALLAAVFEIIPVFGPIISSVPAILLAFADAGIGTGVLLIGLYIIIYQFESQLFYPLVVRKIVGISPIVVILALIVGAKLAGILGALIAVPLSAVLMEYINDVDKRKKAQIAESISSTKI
ncbi:MAG: AI-2E family transporter [Candidatus Taylorbacteria bacterium]|nr:AI-2E family transporter [Candidatus Taylorbacteria bacterium]